MLSLDSLQTLPRELAWKEINGLIRLRFPAIAHLTTQALAQRLCQPNPPILLDARTAEEFAVSHIPQARHIPDLPTVQAELSRQDDLVVYCSVGYRSARLANELQQAGFESVANLEGSIFQWFNEGRLLVRAGQPTRDVHPYNALWGKLLKSP
ncbi:rhodanese-like domain-containing protein [Romeria aff. gracilis LEGE 07310]|uniref:Rhodanese-like domain-containing protein n=1 Tax=Vasconcelosia minhoensis LEGE 07310 TaxID=915328 RepID=A0A8J7AR40_9CYAN|nr:rhodanese-like domain-containing protein [Romeria gracilis]MBE9078886.1 rhodanese-like domain-containing protein [Romeria aff. gracilis LEGE 07310]